MRRFFMCIPMLCMIFFIARAQTTDDLAIALNKRTQVIDSFSQAANIGIVVPNNGEHWSIGDEHTILWHAADFSAEKVKVELSTNDAGSWITLMDSTENDGNERWTPSISHLSETCLLRLSSINDAPAMHQSDFTFSIVPNATEIKGDINFDCQIDTIDHQLIVEMILGTFEPTPAEFWIADINNDNVINSPDLQHVANWIRDGNWTPELHFVSPRAHDFWTVGSDATIQWTSKMISNSSELLVEMSPDRGHTWSVLCDSTKNDGSEVWTPTTHFISNQCRLRISSSRCGHNTISEEFSIFPAVVPVIQPVSFDSVCSPGSEICVEIHIGTKDAPVYNLFGVTFDLEYENNLVTHENGDVGELLGKDVTSYFNDNPNQGIVSVGIDRRVNAFDASTFGCVARLWFKINENASDNMRICFDVLNVVANDAYGGEIPLSAKSHCMIIRDCIKGWPGDTNSDGIVNERDVLLIGCYWEHSGPMSMCRQEAPLEWMPCCCQAWRDRDATIVDTNGDGIINIKDMKALTYFWHMTHAPVQDREEIQPTNPSSNAMGGYVLQGGDSQGQECEALIYVHAVTDILGASCELSLSPAEKVKNISVKGEPFLGEDILFFKNIQSQTATISIGATRKSGQRGVTGTGNIARITFTFSPDSDDAEVSLKFKDVNVIDTKGTSIDMEVTTAINNKSAGDRNELPEFALQQNYPNPFNPTTNINYQIPSNQNVQIVVLNSLGQKVQTLVDETKNAGYHSMTWDGLNHTGEPASSGIYVVCMRAGDFMQTRKMLLLR